MCAPCGRSRRYLLSVDIKDFSEGRRGETEACMGVSFLLLQQWQASLTAAVQVQARGEPRMRINSASNQVDCLKSGKTSLFVWAISGFGEAYPCYGG